MGLGSNEVRVAKRRRGSLSRRTLGPSFADVPLRDGKTRHDGKRHGYYDPFPDHANRWRTRTRSRPSRPVKDTSGT